MNDNIQVSIICNAYNHELYIREALDSFVMQKTNFAFEVLIHDDASTDNTAAIIREYEEKYPAIIKPIYQAVNQYSQNVDIICLFQLPRVSGKYVAMCEGDDYWTDPLKLQKQFDALEAHPEVDMCAHAADQIDATNKELLSIISPRDKMDIIPVEEVIMGEGGFVATNSLMYRAELNKVIPEFRKNFMFDYSYQIDGSLRGGMLFLPDRMAAYRFMSVGSWSVKRTKSKEFRAELLEQKQRMLRELNEYTGGKYNDTISFRMLQNEFEHHYAESDFKMAFDKQYRPIYMKNGFKGYIKLKLKSVFPFLNGITARLKRKKR